jgi:riboflavin kinase/FMN adenylyltransferase
MLALLTSEARHRRLPACVMTFEPHPRDHFARKAGSMAEPPVRIATLRDKLGELERCGIDLVVVARFDEALAQMPAEAFIGEVLQQGLRARYVLVGDDFRFGARRVGNYALLDAAGAAAGFDVARMMSYEVHGLRVSSSAVREALRRGEMRQAEALLGRPYSISGHVVHGRKLGRDLGFPTLNLRFGHPHPAASGIFVVRVQGLAAQPLSGVASLGVRPTLEDGGRVLLEAHCLQWPPALGSDGAYGRRVRVDLLHKLHDERRYDSLEALKSGIAQDSEEARRWWAGAGPAESAPTGPLKSP